jgi:hypothetical protein
VRKWGRISKGRIKVMVIREVGRWGDSSGIVRVGWRDNEMESY